MACQDIGGDWVTGENFTYISTVMRRLGFGVCFENNKSHFFNFSVIGLQIVFAIIGESNYYNNCFNIL